MTVPPLNDERTKGFVAALAAIHELNCFSDLMKPYVITFWQEQGLIQAPEAAMLMAYFGIDK